MSPMQQNNNYICRFLKIDEQRHPFAGGLKDEFTKQVNKLIIVEQNYLWKQNAYVQYCYVWRYISGEAKCVQYVSV